MKWYFACIYRTKAQFFEGRGTGTLLPFTGFLPPVTARCVQSAGASEQYREDGLMSVPLSLSVLGLLLYACF